MAVFAILDKMLYPGAGTQAALKRPFHRRIDLVLALIAVEHKNGDKLPSSVCFTVVCDEPFQKPLQALRPTLSPLPDRPGGTECQRSFLQQFQVVVRVELPFVVSKKSAVGANPLPLIENLHSVNKKNPSHFETCIFGWNGVAILVQDDR